MNISFPHLFTLALAMLGVLVSGIYVSCRGYGICSSDTLREALMWGGGFIFYAVLDYFILMH